MLAGGACSNVSHWLLATTIIWMAQAYDK